MSEPESNRSSDPFTSDSASNGLTASTSSSSLSSSSSFPIASPATDTPTLPSSSAPSYPVARASTPTTDTFSSSSSSSSSATSTPPTSVPSTPATPSGPAPPSLTSTPPSSVLGVPDGLKVIVHFRATGDAPILKKAKFQLSASYRFIVLIDFLRKHLHYKPTDALFLFCNAAFSPSPDALIYDLFTCFNQNNELVIHYATQDAWG